MQQCIDLATKGRGYVGSNPLVGSILVRDGRIIAEGVYMGKGTPHAERQLLEQLNVKTSRRDVSPEDILYVNLEPCCHHGDTPPCIDIIIRSGIKTVVVGMKDPDVRVSGNGIQALRDTGIRVVGPVMPELCRRLNKGFVSLRERGRPYITLKRAQTAQGVTANTDGTKLCITSDEQNTWSHTHLRTTHDAILVGVQTVITDNPLLTIRNTKYEILNSTHQPWRIVLDPDLRIPTDARVVGERCVVIRGSKNTQDSHESKERILKQKGAYIISVPAVNNHFDWDVLWESLSTFPFQLSTLLVEGGEKTWNAFKSAGFVDEEVILVN